MQTFSIKEALLYGIRTFVSHIRFLIIAGLIIAAITLGFAITYSYLIKLIFQLPYLPWNMGNTLKSLESVQGFGPSLALFIAVVIGTVVNIILSFWSSVAWMNVGLKLPDSGSASIEDLFSFIPNLPNIISILVVMALVSIFGVLAFILPGLYWIIRSCYSVFSLLDNPDQNGLDPIRTSFAITKGNFWRLFSLFILFLIFGISVVLLGVSLITVCSLFTNPAARIICMFGN